MPSTSRKQQGFFGIVKALKSGKTPEGINPNTLLKAKKTATNLPEKTINEFLTVNPAKALKKAT